MLLMFPVLYFVSPYPGVTFCNYCFRHSVWSWLPGAHSLVRGKTQASKGLIPIQNPVGTGDREGRDCGVIKGGVSKIFDLSLERQFGWGGGRSFKQRKDCHIQKPRGTNYLDILTSFQHRGRERFTAARARGGRGPAASPGFHLPGPAQRGAIDWGRGHDGCKPEECHMATVGSKTGGRRKAGRRA